jgi:hypothetical protein
MAPQGTTVGWSPVIGPIFAPGNGAVTMLRPESTQSEYDRSILAHLMQSPWDAEFHAAQPVTLAASAVKQEVVGFTPGAARLGIVRGVAMGVALLGDFDNIRWAIELDGTSLPGFDNIRGPFGVFVYPKPLLIAMYPDTVVRIVATNLTALAIPLVTGYLMGTHFPADVFARNGVPA